MTASGTTPLLVQDNKSGQKPQQQVIQASTTWFPRSQLFYRNFTSDDSIKQEEFSQFAKMFKQQRLMMNYSGKDVAIFVQCSSATIHRFEALELSLWSMRKWKPHLQKWLGLVAKSTQVKRLVPNRASQSMTVPLGARQLLQGPEVLESDKGPWRPWSPGNRHGQGAQQR